MERAEILIGLTGMIWNHGGYYYLYIQQGKDVVKRGRYLPKDVYSERIISSDAWAIAPQMTFEIKKLFWKEKII